MKVANEAVGLQTIDLFQHMEFTTWETATLPTVKPAQLARSNLTSTWRK
jgi:O-succinylbenzoate synthase